MKPSITQKHALGCGAACVAFAAGCSYEAVIRALSSSNHSVDQGYWCKDLVFGLNKLGLNYTYKLLKPNLRCHIYQDGVIVFIAKSLRYPSGHYLVRWQAAWMDPWLNFPQIQEVQSGFRKRLPGTPIYVLLPKATFQ